MLNRYQGNCIYCGSIVPAQKGELIKVGEKGKEKWVLTHQDCLQQKKPPLKIRFNLDDVKRKEIRG